MQYEIVVIGTSLGGLHALRVLLAGLPRDFPLPVVIVQHRGKGSDLLAALLQSATALPVREVEDKQPIAPGVVYLAPADYHLLIERGVFMLSTEAPVGFARPSVNVLFETAADAYGPGVIGVILTGANSDGADGVSAIMRRGGLVLVQDPLTAEAAGMPEAARAAGCDRVLPLLDISPSLVRLASESKAGNHAARPGSQRPDGGRRTGKPAGL